MTTKLYLDDDNFITADTEGRLRIECSEVIIDYDKNQAKKIAKFLNYIYGRDKEDGV